MLSEKLMSEWNYKKNKLGPENYTFGSSKKVWWKCTKGHEWEAIISSRTFLNNNCPICCNQKILIGYNDLKTTYPNLIKEWNYDKNILGPESYVGHSNKKVWWKCSKGHEWEVKISNRTRVKGTNCPYCSNKKILIGYNDLSTTHPYLIKQWNYNKNNLGPENYVSGSGKKVWLKCEKNHEWLVRISDKILKNSNCPICCNRKILIGYNDLSTTHPYLIIEWNYDKNNLGPENYVSGSGKKVWWKCKKKHEWKCSISDRTSNNSNCPTCFKESTSSKMEIQYLENIEFILGVCLQKQKFIRINNNNYCVDGFDKNTKTIYEFFGDFWHQNPSLFPIGQIYNDTKNRLNILLRNGYNVVYKWETIDYQIEIDNNIKVSQEYIENIGWFIRAI